MIDDFLNRLEKVRKSGKDYYAVCPVGGHSGKSRTLSLTEKNDVVMGRCFACNATTRDVANALGLNISHINPHWKPSNEKRALPKYTKDQRKLDVYLIEIIEGQDWAKTSLKDKHAYRRAKKRLEQWNTYVQAMYEDK